MDSDHSEISVTTETTYSPQQESAIESMMWAIWDDRCPSIRWSEGDRPHYRAAAIAALSSLGILSA